MTWRDRWPLLAPPLGLLMIPLAGGAWPLALLAALILVVCVMAAVEHAEVVAHRLGEPFGTLVLALAVTVIEVALIVSLMVAGGEAALSLARDTVYAAVMIILDGIVGLCLLLGAARHREQTFGLHGVSASLATLAALVVLTLVLPNYTTTTPGPTYSSKQLAFVAAVSLVLYGTFVLVQTVRHRDYFLPAGPAAATDEVHAEPPTNRKAWTSAALLLVALVSVVLLAKGLAPRIDAVVAAMGAPKAFVGVVIAGIVLLPEATAAVRAARADRLQTSLNLALGSALASIALTIPVVSVLALLSGWKLVLGLGPMTTVLLALSLFVASLSLGTGRTTVLQGAVHLVLFATYVFLTLVP